MSLILLMLAAQTTTCVTNLGITTCDTSPGVTASTSDPWQILRDQQEQQSRQNEERNRQMARADEAAKERRARAYEQVGALIAEGKCEEAKRLASFYGKPDIIKDTARACP